jgi:hypothetical protein
MKYNLTPSQKDAARWIVLQVRSQLVTETFKIHLVGLGADYIFYGRDDLTVAWRARVSVSQLDALAMVQLLRVKSTFSHFAGRETETGKECTLTGAIYEAVDSNFSDDPPPSPHLPSFPNPPEIAMSLDRFRTKFPDPKRAGFLIMRFAAAKPFANIVNAIKSTAEKHSLSIVRADENEFHADLWGNVRTHLHGCGFGIAVYERIETNEPNANVGLEVGYLLAMNKPVLLFKDKTVEVLQADLAGKLYKPFDPHDPAGTIPVQLENWLEDNGVVVPTR